MHLTGDLTAEHLNFIAHKVNIRKKTSRFPIFLESFDSTWRDLKENILYVSEIYISWSNVAPCLYTHDVCSKSVNYLRTEW